MIKLGLIGVGIQGKRYIDTISKIDHCQLIGTCNSQQDWHDLVDQKPDGIIVAADPNINLQVAQYCNMWNIPLLMEKPAALYLSDVEKMNKLKIPILVDYTHLFAPEFMQLQHMKDIHQIIALNYNLGPYRHYTPLYDYLPHDLAMCLTLVPGEVKIIQKHTYNTNYGIMYRLLLKVREVTFRILCGNGVTIKKRLLMVDNQLYDGHQVQDYKAPLTNIVKHFLEIIDGAPCKIPFSLTLQIQQILYQLGKNE